MHSNIQFIYDFTEDELRLQGTLYDVNEKDLCVILVHGMCGTIIDNFFATKWGEKLASNNIGFLYGHNRGHSIENDIIMKDGSFKRYGCMYEIFEDCIYDIDLWIKKAKELGYKKIILAGHSFGCNKVIYYCYKRNPEIEGIIFASAPDMHGFNVIRDKEYSKFIKKAKKNVDSGYPTELLNEMIDGYMYMSSGTYYNWFKEGSNVDNLPLLRNPERFMQLESISVPILAFAGGEEEDLYLMMDRIRQKAINCSNFTYRIINGSNHTYRNFETETADLIVEWVKQKMI